MHLLVCMICLVYAAVGSLQLLVYALLHLSWLQSMLSILVLNDLFGVCCLREFAAPSVCSAASDGVCSAASVGV